MKNNTSIKSFRLRQDLIDLVEQQPGKNFSDKLTLILVEHFKGQKVRQEELAYYNNLIAKKKSDVQHYNDIMMQLATIRRESIQIESHFDKIFESLNEV